MKQHIKSVIAILMCAAVVLGVLCAFPGGTTANAADEVNLLADKNPSFEDYSIPGWTITAGAVQSRDEASGSASTYSLKLAKAGSSATSAKINVTAGKQYTVSAMTKGAAATVEILFFDAQGSSLVPALKTVDASDTWTTFTATISAPSGAASAQVKLAANASASTPAYFDDVTFARAKANAVTITNADFSNGLIGWSNYTVAETDANDGALHVNRPQGNTSYNVPRQQNIAVDGGVNYTLSFDYKHNLSQLGAGNNTILLRVIYYDVGGKPTGGNTLGHNDYFGAKQLVVENWTTYTASVTTPDDAVTMEIYLYFYVYCEGEMWVDNIAMTPAENANLLTENPGFETVSSTNGFPIANWSSPHGNDYFMTDYDASHGYVARIRSDLKEYVTPVRLLSAAVPVTELATYKASVDVSSLDGYAQLYIRYFANDTDTADSTVIAQAFVNSTVDANNWTTITKEFKAPEGAKYARVLIVALIERGGEQSVDVRVDDVRFWQSAAAPDTPAATTHATTAPATTHATTAATTAPATTIPEIVPTETTAPATTAAADTTNTAPPDSTGDNVGVAAMAAVMILAMTTMVALVIGAKKKSA